MAATVFGPYGGEDKRTHYGNLKATLWSDRSSFDSHWRDLGDFLLPRRTRFWPGDRNKGDKRNQNILDSTARFSARTLSSGLHAGLTSPARPWMKLTTPDPELAEFGPVKEWLHLVTQRMLTIFLQTNLYNVLPIIYGDMGVFGTAAMSMIEDTRDLFRCYAYPIGSYALAQNHRGLTATFVREYELTVRQVVEEFGGPDGRPVEQGKPIDWSHISMTVKTLWDQGSYQAPVQVIWTVAPNPEANADRLLAKYLPFSSCHFEAGAEEKKFLRESGYRSFPVMAPRWDVTGEDSYGTDCPGMTALGDIKQLQIMHREKGKAIKKMIDPPLVGPMALRTQKTSLIAGDITYVDQREGMAGLRAIHDIPLNLEHLRADIGETQYRIQRAFYEDLFLMLAQSDGKRGQQPVTAREVDERHEEKLLALGPVLERTNDELLDPIVDRCYELMEARGLVPPVPQELDSVKLKVEYISIMAQAQKLVGVVGQDRFLQTAVPLMEAFPEIRHKVNIFQVIDNYSDMLGLDPRTIIPDDEAKASLDAANKQQQAIQAAETAKTGAQAMQAAGNTPMSGDTALNRLVAGMNGSGAAPAPGAPAQ